MLPSIHQSIALSAHITHGEYEGLSPSDCGAVFGAVSGRKATKSPARGIAKRDLSRIPRRTPRVYWLLCASGCSREGNNEVELFHPISQFKLRELKVTSVLWCVFFVRLTLFQVLFEL